MIGAVGILELPRQAEAGGGKLATLIDLTKCDGGCPDRENPACVAACEDQERGSVSEPADPIPVPFPTRKVEDWSKKKEVSNRLTPYNLILRPKGGGGAAAARRQTLFIPEPVHALRQPRLRDPLPFRRQPQVRKRGRRHRSGHLLRRRQVQDGLPLGDPPAPVGHRHLPQGPADPHGQRHHGQVRSLQRPAQARERTGLHRRLPAGRRWPSGPARRSSPRRRNWRKRSGGHLYGKTENGGTRARCTSRRSPSTRSTRAIKKESRQAGSGDRRRAADGGNGRPGKGRARGARRSGSPQVVAGAFALHLETKKRI
ncbi:MAG: hypothetical protein MZV70_36055 [Desulfobacterales bacterium]|nr:hypothetical protein [Desulfobacterales bacterium]